MIEPDNADDAPRQASSPRPLVAALLSLLAPGAGHLYAGRFLKGFAAWLLGSAFVWLALFAGLTSTFVGLIVLLVGVVAYWVGVAVSAVLDARRARGAELSRVRWLALAALVVFQVLLGGVPSRSWLPVRAFHIPSGSMEPTVRVGDYLMADVRVWKRREPRRGELVVHRDPKRAESFFLRRVAGLPGEIIEIRDKRVFVDGEALEEPWATHSDRRTYPDSRFAPPMFRARDQFGPLRVPEGTFFLLGDNRDNANDSRFVGPIDRSLLVGRPLYLYWSRDRDRIGRSLVGPPEH